MNCEISVVIPVYKSPESLTELHKRLIFTLKKIVKSYEIIFVNDGSPMNDWEIIKDLASKDKNVKGINLSRNFGQHNAITAGLENCCGDVIVVMDCDLQDKPEDIEILYIKYKEGFDLVLGSRKRSGDNILKKLFSKTFYKILSYLTETEQDSSIGNFGVYNRKVINAVLSMNDYIKYFPTMVMWTGFNKTTVEVEHSNRIYSNTSYNLKKLIKLALGTIISFSDKPLRLVINLGLIISFSAVFFGIYNLIQYYYGNIKVSGWASIIISIWFLSGIIIFVLGIVGIYAGKIFEKVKQRPNYIAKDKINF